MKTKMYSLVLSVALLHASAGLAMAAIDKIQSAPGIDWYTTQVVANSDYTALGGSRDTYNWTMCTKPGGGADVVAGGTVYPNTYNVTGTYTAICLRNANNYDYFGASASGGLNRFYYDAIWYTESKTTGPVYSAIAESGQSDWVLCARSTGGLDIYNGGSIAVSNWNISSAKYNALVALKGTGRTFDFLGAKAGGGLDHIYYSHSDGWHYEVLSGITTEYSALASNAVISNWVLAAKVGGGLDVVSSTGILATNLGGITKKYSALTFNAGTAYEFFGQVVPEPATVVILGLGGILISRLRR